MSTLVTYASEHGSTREIAERIHARLLTKISPVHCLPIESVNNPDKYEAIVIGSAVHGQAWIPSATVFVHKHSSTLSSVPVFAFSVGDPDAAPKRFRKKLREEEEKRLGEVARREAHARDHVLLSGKFEKQDVPCLPRMILTCCGWRFGDNRDWNAIDRWADSVGDKLQGSQQP